MASNGVVHLIDTVLMLPSKDSTGSTMVSTSTSTSSPTGSTTSTTTMRRSSTTSAATTENDSSIFGLLPTISSVSTLKSAIDMAPSIVSAVKGYGPFTVFAPTNSAFGKLDSSSLNAILASTDKLTTLLDHHIVLGKYTASELYDKQVLQTEGGEELIVIATGSGFAINTNGDTSGTIANIQNVDITATNGVIHTIDTVVFPSSLVSTTIRSTTTRRTTSSTSSSTVSSTSGTSSNGDNSVDAASSSSGGNGKPSSSGGDNSGAVAGGIIGGIILVALVVVGVVQARKKGYFAGHRPAVSVSKHVGPSEFSNPLYGEASEQSAADDGLYETAVPVGVNSAFEQPLQDNGAGYLTIGGSATEADAEA